MTTTTTQQEAADLADKYGVSTCQGTEWRFDSDQLAALIAEARASQQSVAVPVAWLYTLEYGEKVASTLVSKEKRNYPFGVCGADYLAKNDDGVSYVRQTPLYAAPHPPAPPEQARGPLTDERIEDLAEESGGWWDGNTWQFEDADLHPFARAVIAATEGEPT